MARNQLSEATKWQIVGMRQGGMSLRQIATRVNVCHSVISRLLKKHRQTGEVKVAAGRGRPKKTDLRDDRRLLRMARQQPFWSSNQLRQWWQQTTGVNVSRELVNKRLLAARLRARRPVKRPRLTDNHMRLRLAWAQARQNWNLRTWRRVIWSDESRYNLYVADGRLRVRRLPNTALHTQNILTTVAGGGGSVMVWAAFCHDQKVDIKVIQGTMNAEKYGRAIIEDTLLPFLHANPQVDYIYQDDNARPHRARIVTDLKTQHNIESLDWPSVSPDLNPIEHVWDAIGRRISQRNQPVANIRELRQAVVDEWNNLPMQFFRKLVVSMRRRCQEVVQARGGYTHY